MNSPATEPSPFSNRAMRWRQAIARFWLRQFFRIAERAPGLLIGAKPIIRALVFRFSPAVRAGTRANAARLLGPDSTPARRDRLARQVIGQFLLFCIDVARGMKATQDQLVALVEEVVNHDAYVRSRSSQRGVIIVTAHLGSFEVGIAALRAWEPDIHVVFRRDAVDQFEQHRAQLRRRLGVHEAALNDGWSIWIRLRNALLANQAVVLQGDRVLPGQKGQRVAILGGHLELPTGPIKLALATGAPILPVFTIRTPGGKIRLFVEEPIHIDPNQAPAEEIDRVLRQLAGLLEKYLRAYPEQWLVLEPAWCEDRNPPVTLGEA